MDGWVKLHRCLLQKPIWLKSTPEQKVILITLLMMANHKENEWEWKGEKFNVKPGQMITSLAGIKEKCGDGISIQNIRTALKRFEKYEFLTNESTKAGRLITIVNWQVYQCDSEQANKDDNKRLTKTSQRPNKDLTTNKNDKNEKNEKNIYAEFVKMTEAEYQKLVEKYGEEKTNKMIDTLDNYKGATGKKYKSDYRAILNWVADKVMKETQNNSFRNKAYKPLEEAF